MSESRASSGGTGHVRFEHLLAPGRIGTLELRNRILMAPMGSNLCEPDGQLGRRILRYYEERARGGAGMLILGVAAIAFPAGACNPNQVGISNDTFLPGLSELARRVHAHGCKLAVQLQHAGKVAVRDMVEGRPMWVPSVPEPKAGDLTRDLTKEERDDFTRDLRGPRMAMKYREMSVEDIATVVALFADAAERARRAGFDGVELHAGHGYLLSSFLSPASNHRRDAYGGVLENRARFLVETLRAVKERVGRDFPVWCRLDGVELDTPGGISVEDARRTAELAEAAGADAIHVSAYADSSIGAAFTKAPLVHQPEGFVDLARGIKQRVGVPVIAVGRIEPERADALIESGVADFIAMARKLLADPELPRKLEAGQPDRVRPCIYCYTCVGRIFLTKQSACAVNPRSGREHATPELALAAEPRNVLVVGGGPAGMEAARLAALVGHSVTLCERNDRLGGALRIGAQVYEPNAKLLAWLESELERLGVTVERDRELTAAAIEARQPQVVLVATGAKRIRPAVPGANAPHIWTIAQLLDTSGTLRVPGRQLVIQGGGGPGLSLADHWSEQGRAAVTVLEPSGNLGADLAPPRRWQLLARLRERGVELVKNATLDSLKGSAVRFTVATSGVVDKSGETRSLPADTVFLTGGWHPDTSLARELEHRGLRVHTLGDAAEIGRIEGAMASANRLVRTL